MALIKCLECGKEINTRLKEIKQNDYITIKYYNFRNITVCSYKKQNSKIYRNIDICHIEYYS